MTKQPYLWHRCFDCQFTFASRSLVSVNEEAFEQ